MAAVLAQLNASAPVPARPGWQARLTLRFARRDDGTLLAERRHHGPLRVQRPLYPEGPDVCHVLLLHPPGGVVGGDELRMDIAVASGAHALITTPAAGKFYRCEDTVGRVEQRIGVDAEAVMEWLPQETIVYAGARAETTTRVDVAAGGRFIGWEILCLGRPVGDAPFATGTLRQRIEIWRDDAPLWLERSRYDGGASALASAWGLRGHTVTATLVCVGGDAALVEAIRAAVAPGADEAFGVTRLRDVTVCRYLGPSAERARRCLMPAWWQMRWALLRRGPHRPRIWDT